MREHSSLQITCGIWITFGALDEALPACLAALRRLLAHFPRLCMAASAWEVLYPPRLLQGIFKDDHKAPLVWFTAWVNTMVIQIIRIMSKFPVCFCSNVVRSGVNGEARVCYCWGIEDWPLPVHDASVWLWFVFGWIDMVRCSWTHAGLCSSELAQCVLEFCAGVNQQVTLTARAWRALLEIRPVAIPYGLSRCREKTCIPC